MRDEDRLRVRHMIDAAEATRQFLSGKHVGDLNSDRMLLFAVVRAIEVLGEAAGKVSNEARECAPKVPWGAIVSMRNRLIHGYFDIDSVLVWKTATEEIPALLPQLRALADQL